MTHNEEKSKTNEMNDEIWDANFPTKRRVTRRKIIPENCPPTEELEEWVRKEGVKIGPLVPDGYRHLVLCGLWTWRDLNAVNMEDVPQTDLIRHRINLVNGSIPYATRNGRRLSQYQEEWLARYIKEGMDCGMYERTPIEEPLSRWSAPPVLVTKDPTKEIPVDPAEFKDGPVLRLTFNYHHVHEDLPAVDHVLASSIHDLLSNPKNKVMSKGDLKNGYWAVGVEKDCRHILAFNIQGIGQLRPTRMPQGCRSSSSTFAELGKIAFGAIPPPNPEPPLVSRTFGVFVDDMFATEEDPIKHFHFLFDELFPRLIWAMLRMAFSKLEIFMESLKGLGQIFRIGGEVHIVPQRVEKIMSWPSPTNKSEVRGFMGAVQICRRWIKNFTEIARPLTRLQGTAEWRWTLVEETSFRILKNKSATVVAMFGVIWEEPVRCYFDASGFAGGFALTQIQDLIERPIIYDSFAFNPTQRKYGTYKRELLAIIHFAEKYKHYLTTNLTATFFTDHKPLITFINSDRHEGIYARWAMKLQNINFKFIHIEGKRNTIADGLSRTIFPGDDPTVDEEFGTTICDKETGDPEWFWKDGKGGYEELLRRREEELAKANAGKDKEQKGESKKSLKRKAEVESRMGLVETNAACGCFHLLTRDGDGGLSDKLSLMSMNEYSPMSMGESFPMSTTVSSPMSVNIPTYCSTSNPVKSHLSTLFNARCVCTRGEGSGMSEREENNKDEGSRGEEEEEISSEYTKGHDFVNIFCRTTTLEKSGKWEKDEWYRDIYRYLTQGGIIPKGMDTVRRATFKKNADKYRAVDGDLFHYDQPRKRLIPCILETDVRRVLAEAHDNCGHYASAQVVKKLQLKAWWPDRNTDVKTYIDGCINCAKFGPAIRSHSLQPTLTYKPFDLIGMDFIGPLPESTNGFKYIFQIIDYFSRYTKAWSCKTCTASEVTHHLAKFFEEYPIPICIYSDRGTHFKSPEVRSLTDMMEITHILSPSGSSKSTGMIEKANSELQKAVKRMAGDRMSSWDLFLGRATRAVNTRNVVALGFTPFEILFGIQPRLPFELSFPDESISSMKAWVSNPENKEALHDQDWEESLLSRSVELRAMRKIMLEKWEARNVAMKTRYDKGVKGWTFNPGDLVMLYDNTIGAKAKGKGKLAIQWPGPYMVESKGGDHGKSYRLRHIHGRKIPGTHHGDHLKIFRPRSGRLSQPFDEEPAIGPKAIRHLRNRATAKRTRISRSTLLDYENVPNSPERWIFTHHKSIRLIETPPNVQVANDDTRNGIYNEEEWGLDAIHVHWAKVFWLRVEGEEGV